MTETQEQHKHEWKPLFDRKDPQPWEAAEWRCECSDLLTFEQIKRRLNIFDALREVATAVDYFLDEEYKFAAGKSDYDKMAPDNLAETLAEIPDWILKQELG